MANSFQASWFRDSRPSSSVEEARAELERLAAARPELLSPARWLCEMLPDLVPAASAPILPLQPERGRAKLREGIPLLRGERVAIDAKTFRQSWRRACTALETQQADGTAAALADAVERGRLDPAKMVDAVIAGRPGEIRNWVEELGLDAGLATTLLKFVLAPLFAAIEAAIGNLRTGVPWERGYCPTCGSWPLLGELRGLNQSRYLRCGLCTSEWEVSRLWCPFCGNRDHERLGFLHSEVEETNYRASVCDECRGYVKMVSTLSALPPTGLLVAEVATLHLDMAAAERGYTNHF